MLEGTIAMLILASFVFVVGLWGAAGAHPPSNKQNKPRSK